MSNYPPFSGITGRNSPVGAVATLPLLVLDGSAIDYAPDPDRPSLLARVAMSYPAATIASLTATPQGFSIANSGNGAGAMVATGGLDPGVPRGYIRFTPNVSAGRDWDSGTRTSYASQKTYGPISEAPDATCDQWWVCRWRVPSSVVIANTRYASFMISDPTNAVNVARILINYAGSAWVIYTDSLVLAPVQVATSAGVANAGIWFAIKRPANSRTVLVYYSTAAGTSPPALAAFTLLGTHTNLMSSAQVSSVIGFTTGNGVDTATAYAADMTYYDDTLALPSLSATALARIAAGAWAALPVQVCGYNPNQPELVIAQGACSEILTQTRIRAILAASENARANYDTCTWEWKVERSTTDSGYSGGSFTVAALMTVAGTGPYIRVTVRPAADGTSPGSLDLVTMSQWSTA